MILSFEIKPGRLTPDPQLNVVILRGTLGYRIIGNIGHPHQQGVELFLHLLVLAGQILQFLFNPLAFCF